MVAGPAGCCVSSGLERGQGRGQPEARLAVHQVLQERSRGCGWCTRCGCHACAGDSFLLQSEVQLPPCTCRCTAGCSSAQSKLCKGLGFISKTRLCSQSRLAQVYSMCRLVLETSSVASAQALPAALRRSNPPPCLRLWCCQQQTSSATVRRVRSRLRHRRLSRAPSSTSSASAAMVSCPARPASALNLPCCSCSGFALLQPCAGRVDVRRN